MIKKTKEEYGCGATIALLLIAIGLIFFIVWIGWLLWGAIAVSVFGLPALSYWQFFGLYILCNILFKSHSSSSKSSD